MGRFAKDNGGGDFQPCPVGMHAAICVGLIDIGTHHGEWQGQPTVRTQVIIRWETPLEVMEDGQPFIVSSFYTNSLSEKSKLRPLLQSWRGREFTPEELAGFDLQNILGKPCMLNVIHNDKGKAVVSAVTPVPKGFQMPKEPINKPTAFWIEEWDEEQFKSLPAGFQKLIMESDEFKARVGAKAPSRSAMADLAEDIPFMRLRSGYEI